MLLDELLKRKVFLRPKFPAVVVPQKTTRGWMLKGSVLFWNAIVTNSAFTAQRTGFKNLLEPIPAKVEYMHAIKRPNQNSYLGIIRGVFS